MASRSNLSRPMRRPCRYFDAESPCRSIVFFRYSQGRPGGGPWCPCDTPETAMPRQDCPTAPAPLACLTRQEGRHADR